MLINELSEKDTDVDQQPFVTSPHDCPPLVSCHNVVVAHKFSAHLGEKSQNAYIWAKQVPHSFKEVGGPCSVKIYRP
jgi:hypothetical protein